MASAGQEFEPPGYPSCFYFRELPEAIPDIVSPIAKLGVDAAFRELEDISLQGGIIDPEALGEKLQIGEDKPSHPFAEGLRRQIHNLQTFFQRRHFPFTAT